MTRAEAAAYLRVHKDTIRNMQERGELSTVMISGLPRVPEFEVHMAAIGQLNRPGQSQADLLAVQAQAQRLRSGDRGQWPQPLGGGG
jgi:excisionase family DNA binding protein